MELSRVINAIRKDKKLTLEDLSKLSGVPLNTIKKISSGATKNPKIDTLQSLSKVLGCTLDDFDENPSLPHPDLRPVKMKKFPMIGNIACGKPILANEEFESFVEANSNINADFCLTAQGDSMINARIFDGDVVFIKEQPLVDNGQIAAIVIDDSVTLKRFYRDGNTVRLVAENPTVATLIFSGEELNKIHILGRAVAFQSNLR